MWFDMVFSIFKWMYFVRWLALDAAIFVSAGSNAQLQSRTNLYNVKGGGKK
jgi:outer membrane receptor for monomeric catechols